MVSGRKLGEDSSSTHYWRVPLPGDATFAAVSHQAHLASFYNAKTRHRGHGCVTARCAPLERNGMTFEILLVDDNAGDVRLLQEAFREVDPTLHLHVANDGVEAVAFLEQQGDHIDAPRPDLILLDLNLPKVDGREVLAHVKEDASLRTIPTLILSISDAEADIAKVYYLQANCYLIKPVEWDDFLRLVKSIKDFWLTTAKLPPKKTRG